MSAPAAPPLRDGSALSQAGAVLRLARADRSLIAAGYCVIGAHLADAAGDPWRACHAAAVVFLVVSFGNMVNDHEDVSADTLKRPDRPIPSGLISRPAAARLAVTTAIAALATAFLLGPVLGLFAAGTVVLAAAYSLRLKGTLLLGNAAVATLVAASLPFGALSVGSVGIAVASAAGVAFAFVLAQEVLFTLEDEETDRAVGVGSTANRLGPAATVALLRALLAIVVVVTLLPAFNARTPYAYLASALLCIVLPTVVVIALLAGPLTETSIRRSVRMTRCVWISGAIPLLFLPV